MDCKKKTNNYSTIKDLRAEIENLNKKAYEECQNHINNAIDNVLNGAKYERLDEKGNINTFKG